MARSAEKMSGAGPRVEVRGGLVEDKQRRVSRQCAGERNSLSLSPRELGALAADKVERCGMPLLEQSVEARYLNGAR